AVESRPRGGQSPLGQPEVIVLAQRVLQRLRGGDQRRSAPPVELGPVEELDPPFQPPEPEEQIAGRPENQEGEQALRLSEQAGRAAHGPRAPVSPLGEHSLHNSSWSACCSLAGTGFGAGTGGCAAPTAGARSP